MKTAITTILCAGFAATSAAAADSYRCDLGPHDTFSRGMVPDVVSFSIDEASGRAKVTEYRPSEGSTYEAFADVSSQTASKIVLSWKGGPISKFGGRIVTFRLSLNLGSGKARLKSSVSAGRNTIEGIGQCSVQ